MFLSVVGEKFAVVIWIGTFCYGLFSASLVPSSISWMVKFFNLSGITFCMLEKWLKQSKIFLF